MKRLLGIFLALALLMGAALGEGLEWNPTAGSPAEADGRPAHGNQLGLILLQEGYESGKNSVVSPYSLALALGMAAEGAQGETLAQLKEILCVDELTELTETAPAGLHSANAVFTRPEIQIKEDYSQRLSAGYAAEWFAINDDVANKVNDWVKSQTGGLIDELMNEAPASQTALLLVNAIAMDADWASPFASEATNEETFYTRDGEIAVEMMRQTGYFDYAEKDGVQIIRLPYAGNDLEMWAALPVDAGEKGLDMPALLDVLAAAGTFYLSSDAQRTEVELSMPKFDISDESSFAEPIRAMGMELPFGESADFSGISDTPLAIDEIIQKARIQVDEAGTKAAAATMVAMRAMAMAPGEKPEPVVMKLDRPFAFVIRDAASGSVCFAGVVENPAA